MQFALFNASGNTVQTTTAPLWLTPAKGGPTTARIDQDDFATSTSDTGTTYRYNGGLYQYN